MDNNKKKETDRDFRPTRGQEGNENWDDNQSNEPAEKTANKNADNRRTDEPATTGGSDQRNKEENISLPDADLEHLPGEKGKDRGTNLTGPGLG